MMNLPNLLTKLHRPPLPPHLAHRPHLIERLNQGLARSHKLTQIVAPAGFGKTTLLSQWTDDLHAQRAPARGDGQQEVSASTTA